MHRGQGHEELHPLPVVRDRHGGLVCGGNSEVVSGDPGGYYGKRPISPTCGSAFFSFLIQVTEIFLKVP